MLCFCPATGWTETASFWIAGSKGVVVAELDTESGEISPLRVASQHSLTWMAAGRRNLLWAGSSLADKDLETNGALSAFRVEKNATLQFLHQIPALGKTTIYVAADRDGLAVFATNFRKDSYPSRGSVVSFEVTNGGRFGKNLQRFEHPGRGGSDSDRQLASHPHAIVVGPVGDFAAVPDLGVDKVYLYRVLESGRGLQQVGEVQGRPGQQPRHLAWHPNGRYFYTMNEAQPTVSVARWDRSKEEGEFIQHISRIQGNGGGGADLRIDTEGRFLYGSNRGEDTIVAYRIEPGSGKLSLAGHVPSGGASTRSMAISPGNRWLVAAHQGSDLVNVFSIDPETGELAATPFSMEIEQPACVLFREE